MRHRVHDKDEEGKAKKKKLTTVLERNDDELRSLESSTEQPSNILGWKMERKICQWSGDRKPRWKHSL